MTLYSYQSNRGDAVFSKIVPNNNYGTLEDIHLYAWTQNGVLNVNRVLVDFNTSEIIPGTKINHAYLNIYYNTTSQYDIILGGKGNLGEDSFLVEEVVSEWNEKTVTWANQPIVNSLMNVVILKKIDPKANYIKLDVTEIVQSMILKPVAERYGLRLKLENEIPYNVYFFASGNHPIVNLRPSLEIDF